jgi:hypothetical protein
MRNRRSIRRRTRRRRSNMQKKTYKKYGTGGKQTSETTNGIGMGRGRRKIRRMRGRHAPMKQNMKEKKKRSQAREGPMGYYHFPSVAKLWMGKILSGHGAFDEEAAPLEEEATKLAIGASSESSEIASTSSPGPTCTPACNVRVCICIRASDDPVWRLLEIRVSHHQ